AWRCQAGFESGNAGRTSLPIEPTKVSGRIGVKVNKPLRQRGDVKSDRIKRTWVGGRSGGSQGKTARHFGAALGKIEGFCFVELSRSNLRPCAVAAEVKPALRTIGWIGHALHARPTGGQCAVNVQRRIRGTVGDGQLMPLAGGPIDGGRQVGGADTVGPGNKNYLGAERIKQQAEPTCGGSLGAY